MVTAHAPPPLPRTDTQAALPDLVRRLADDSKRLARDEVQLAKLELQESGRTGAHGSIQIALAVAFGIVAAVALTVLGVTAVSAALGDKYWAGALIVGAVEALIGALVLRRGIAIVKHPPSPLAASRESLKDTASWAHHPASR
jgi:uncharacterized membrane protein YqjE